MGLVCSIVLALNFVCIRKACYPSGTVQHAIKRIMLCVVGKGDLVVPTVGEVQQYARAGERPSGIQPDFDAFFHDETEEDEYDREGEGVRRDSTANENMRDVDPTSGFRRGDEPLRRDYEFLRQWEERENEQRGGRSFDLRRNGAVLGSEGSNFNRRERDRHSPMGDGFKVGTQIHVVG